MSQKLKKGNLWNNKTDFTGLLTSLESCEEPAVLPARQLCNNSQFEKVAWSTGHWKSLEKLYLCLRLQFTPMCMVWYITQGESGIKEPLSVMVQEQTTIFLSLAISRSPSLLSREQKKKTCTSWQINNAQGHMRVHTQICSRRHADKDHKVHVSDWSASI